MRGEMLRALTIAVVAICFSDAALAAGARPRHAPAYKADRVSAPWAAQPILDTPGQTTVLTRQILDDMNATSLRDALRLTAGVTIGR